jgi:hypothetical protein
MRSILIPSFLHLCMWPSRAFYYDI